MARWVGPRWPRGSAHQLHPVCTSAGKGMPRLFGPRHVWPSEMCTQDALFLIIVRSRIRNSCRFVLRELAPRRISHPAARFKSFPLCHPQVSSAPCHRARHIAECHLLDCAIRMSSRTPKIRLTTLRNCLRSVRPGWDKTSPNTAQMCATRCS
jgi:hypothetical protein